MVSMSENMQQQESTTDRQGSHAPGNRAAATKGAGAGSAIANGLGQQGRAILERAVARDVIPRLVALPWITKTSGVNLRQQVSRPSITEASVRRLIDLCMESEPQGVAGFVADLHRCGLSACTIYEDLLTPVARRLGDMWENDTCTFADVTLGVLRLQNAQRALAAESLTHAAPALGAPRALLMPVPGEQHTFGLSIVLDYFTRAGWDARLGPASTVKEALALVRKERTELVGISFACDDRIADAQALIVAIRAASSNKRLLVMVGGPSFMADPTLARAIGADATATDGHQAVLRANELLHAPDAAAPGVLA